MDSVPAHAMMARIMTSCAPIQWARLPGPCGTHHRPRSCSRNCSSHDSGQSPSRKRREAPKCRLRALHWHLPGRQSFGRVLRRCCRGEGGSKSSCETNLHAPETRLRGRAPTLPLSENCCGREGGPEDFLGPALQKGLCPGAGCRKPSRTLSSVISTTSEEFYRDGLVSALYTHSTLGQLYILHVLCNGCIPSANRTTHSLSSLYSRMKPCRQLNSNCTVPMNEN